MNNYKETIEIALATYNGSPFIGQFLDSLAGQTVQDWRIVFRDDGSTDMTDILILDHPELQGRVRKATGDTSNLGVVRNFSTILEQTTSAYVMLADQDDVWYPSKLEKMLGHIRKLERKWPAKPLLVFCDLHIVASDLTLIHDSYIRHQGLSQLRHAGFKRLLTQNVAPGCAMIFNRVLLERALPIPESAAMHDWWLIQVASLLGHVEHLPEPLLAYRQHGGNLIGAKRLGLAGSIGALFSHRKSYRLRLDAAQHQARELLERFGPSMNTDERKLTEAFTQLSTRRPPFRQWSAWRAGLHKVGRIRDLGFYALM